MGTLAAIVVLLVACGPAAGSDSESEPPKAPTPCSSQKECPKGDCVMDPCVVSPCTVGHCRS